MAATGAPSGPLPTLAPAEGTVWGASAVRRALDRFETLIALAISVSAVTLFEAYLTSVGVLPASVPSGARPFWEWQRTAGALGLEVALALAIAALVIAAIVVAVTGLVAWRRGVLVMARASAEFGPEQVRSAGEARADHARTLWLFLGYVLVAIVVAIVVAATNMVLDRSGMAALPDLAGSLATGLATGSVLVAIYYYGGRHLSELLYAISSSEGRRELALGRRYLFAGALVGLGAALSPISFWFGAVALLSLALILVGAYYLRRAYGLWLAGERAGTAPPGPVPRAA